MAVTGWNEHKLRPAGSTTGDETGIFTFDDGSGTTGIVTRTANDGVGDFVFTAKVHSTTTWGTGNMGGFCWGVQADTAHHYAMYWHVGTVTTVTICKDSIGGTSSGTILSTSEVSSISSSNIDIVITKSGNDVSVIWDGTDMVNIATSSTIIESDPTYSNGKIGFIYPSAQWSGAMSKYQFTSITGGVSTLRRRLMIM